MSLIEKLAVAAVFALGLMALSFGCMTSGEPPREGAPPDTAAVEVPDSTWYAEPGDSIAPWAP